MKKAVNFRLEEEKHDALAKISAQSGVSMARLLELGAQWVIEQVKETGRVPVPVVSLEPAETGEEVAA